MDTPFPRHGNLCVFAGSQAGSNPRHLEAAAALGQVEAQGFLSGEGLRRLPCDCRADRLLDLLGA